MNMFSSFLICLLLTGCRPGSDVKGKAPSFPVPGIEFAPEIHICYRADSPLCIDGKLDEITWKKTPWTADFVDIQGKHEPAPKFRTRVKMLWDDRYLYVAAELEEPHVWAILTDRDSVIFQDNDFEIFMDPDGDTHNYFELEVNALGAEWDLLLLYPYRDGDNPAIDSWDIQGLKTGVSIDGTINDPRDEDRGWTVEIAIPWKVTGECARRAPPVHGDQWRTNFSRVEWPVEVTDGKYRKPVDPGTGQPLSENNWVWSPQGLVNMHYPEMWGFIQFSRKVAGGGEDTLEWNPVEDAKWALRQVYYYQKTYFMKHGKYSDNLSDPSLEGLTLKHYSWPPKLTTTQSFFEAVLKSKTGREEIHISQDGRIW